MELLREGAIAAERTHTQSVRRRRRQDHDDDARRAALTQMGELSVARQALEGVAVVPGTMSTFESVDGQTTSSSKGSNEQRWQMRNLHKYLSWIRLSSSLV